MTFLCLKLSKKPTQKFDEFLTQNLKSEQIIWLYVHYIIIRKLENLRQQSHTEINWPLMYSPKVIGDKYPWEGTKSPYAAQLGLKSAVLVFDFTNRFVFNIFWRCPIDTATVAESFSTTDIQNCYEYCSNY